MIFLSKGLIGAVVVLMLIVLSKTDNYYIAGLIPLFPSFGILAHIIVYKDRGIDALKETILFGIFSIIPYFLYLIGIYYSILYYNFFTSILIGILLWIISSIILIKSWDFICSKLGYKEILVHENTKDVD
ncbi:MAG: GlpM family protein [Campylobacterota bacterium]|nr:GlpM family protein [Campylobacterota bacterium]